MNRHHKPDAWHEVLLLRNQLLLQLLRHWSFVVNHLSQFPPQLCQHLQQMLNALLEELSEVIHFLFTLVTQE